MPYLLILLACLWLWSPVSAATVGQDTFLSTDTSTTCGTGTGICLENWTPTCTGTCGAVWDPLVDASLYVYGTTDRLLSNTTGQASARKEDNLGTDEMNVSALLQVHDMSTSRRSSICGRVGTDFDNDYVCALLHGNTTDVQLRLVYRTTSSTWVEQGTAFTLASVTPYVVRLEIRTTSQLVYVDGVLRITGTDATTDYAGQQFAGVHLNSNNNTGTFIDDFLSETPAGGAARRAIIINSLHPWPLKAPQEWVNAFMAWIRHR